MKEIKRYDTSFFQIFVDLIADWYIICERLFKFDQSFKRLMNKIKRNQIIYHCACDLLLCWLTHFNDLELFAADWNFPYLPYLVVLSFFARPHEQNRDHRWKIGRVHIWGADSTPPPPRIRFPGVVKPAWLKILFLRNKKRKAVYFRPQHQIGLKL